MFRVFKFVGVFWRSGGGHIVTQTPFLVLAVRHFKICSVVPPPHLMVQVCDKTVHMEPILRTDAIANYMLSLNWRGSEVREAVV